MTDQQLLRRFSDEQDTEAFAQVVRRHIDFVYGAARRQTPSEAEDVTQAVFVLLSRKARHVRKQPSVVGWLYRATRYCCMNARKMERRRAFHEREAGQAMLAKTSGKPRNVMETLDEAMAKLPEAYREAVLMRYLEGHSIAETAVMLGISEATAAKRAGRGLEKLRGFFSNAGFNLDTASITGTLLAEAAKTAPALVTQRVLTSVSKGTVAVKATLLAQATGNALAGTHIKLAVAIIVGAVGLVGVTAAVVHRVTAGAPAPSAMHVTTTPSTPAPGMGEVVVDETHVPGGVAVAQYQALVESDVAAEIVRLTQEIPSQSTFYELRRGSAQAVREVMDDATRTGGVVALNQIFRNFPLANYPAFNGWSMEWGSGAPYVDIKRGEANFSFSSDAYEQNNFAARSSNGQMEFKINLNQKVVTLSHWVQPQPRDEMQMRMDVKWTGTVQRGQTLVMVGDLNEWRGEHFVSVIITEAYAAKDYQGSFINHLFDAPTWLDKGPVGAQAWADRAWVWSHQNAPPPTDTVKTEAKWTRTLSDGTVVQLCGVSSPAKWPFCWWDGDGTALTGDYMGQGTSLESPLAVALQVRKPNENRDLLRKQNDWDISQLFEGIAYPLKDGENQITIYVPTTPWKEQNIKPGEMVKFGDRTIMLKAQPWGAGQCLGELHGNWEPQLQANLYAVTKAGQRLDPQFMGQANIVIVTRDKKPEGDIAPSFNAELKDVDHFVLATRQREPATFEGFAAVPRVLPPPAVSAQEVAAMEKLETERKSDENWVEQEKILRAYDAIPRDEATPLGALRVMLDKAMSGDVQGVRARLAGSDPELVDAVARGITGVEHALEMCDKKLDARTMWEAFDKRNIEVSMENGLLSTEWDVIGDAASQSQGPGRMTLKDGRWRWDVDSIAPKVSHAAMIEQAQHVEKDLNGLEADLQTGRIKDAEGAAAAIAKVMNTVAATAHGATTQTITPAGN